MRIRTYARGVGGNMLKYNGLVRRISANLPNLPENKFAGCGRLGGVFFIVGNGTIHLHLHLEGGVHQVRAEQHRHEEKHTTVCVSCTNSGKIYVRNALTHMDMSKCNTLQFKQANIE